MNEYGLKAIQSGEALALKGFNVIGRIAGLLAQTTLTQTYRNATDQNLELAYTFPLPVGATLLSFQVRVGDRQFAGEVIPRKEAEVAYEEAIAGGNSAFRLQEIRPGMYSATLGNVMVGESVEITLSFVETLAWNGKSLRYRLPTTLAPRYGEPTGMQPWQRPVTSLEPEYPLALSVILLGALAESAIACPSHRVTVKPGEEGLLVTLAAGATLDRDFILEIENTAVQSVGVAASARDTHVALLSLLPPEVQQSQGDRDTVIVIDCSGSMQGDSLAQAKEGVQLALGSLDPGERFGIIAFGSNFVRFDRELQPANRKNLDMARRWVKELHDLGGTEMHAALEAGLAFHDGKPMDILLLTDGQAWELGEIIRKAKEKGIRIFTVGIGSSVAEDTVRSLADQTGGSCELVSPNEDMSARIYRHFNRMRQPRLSWLDIGWPVPPLWEVRPEAACFAGDAYTVAAAFDQPVASSLPVKFAFAEAEAVALEVPLTVDPAIADAVVRVSACRRLAQLPENAHQDWAVRYQLITDKTDYLITLERAVDEKAMSLPELQVQPQMLPAGWGGTGSVRRQAFEVLNTPASAYFSPARASAAPSIDYCQRADVPAVMRKRNVTPGTASTIPAYDQFIRRLNALAEGKRSGGLPASVRGILGIPLPDELECLLHELEQESVPEEAIVLAFYQALLDHSGADELCETFLEAAETFIAQRTASADVAARWVEALERLFDARLNGEVDGAGRYDIPAFLRRSAD